MVHFEENVKVVGQGGGGAIFSTFRRDVIYGWPLIQKEYFYSLSNMRRPCDGQGHQIVIFGKVHRSLTG